MRAQSIAPHDRRTQPSCDPVAGLFFAAPRQQASSRARRAARYQQLRIDHGRVAFKRILIACEVAGWTPARATGLLTFAKWFVDQCMRRRRPGSLPKAKVLAYPGRHPDTTRAYLRFLFEVVAPSGAWEWAEVDGAVLMSGFFTGDRHRAHLEERWQAERKKDAERAARRRAAGGAPAEKRRRRGPKPQAERGVSRPSTPVSKPLSSIQVCTQPKDTPSDLPADAVLSLGAEKKEAPKPDASVAERRAWLAAEAEEEAQMAASRRKTSPPRHGAQAMAIARPRTPDGTLQVLVNAGVRMDIAKKRGWSEGLLLQALEKVRHAYPHQTDVGALVGHAAEKIRQGLWHPRTPTNGDGRAKKLGQRGLAMRRPAPVLDPLEFELDDDWPPIAAPGPSLLGAWRG